MRHNCVQNQMILNETRHFNVIHFCNQVTYYVVDSSRNEGKQFFEINRETGWISTKIVFDREKQGAYALEVEARDGAPSARPNSNGQPNSGMSKIYITFSSRDDQNYEISLVAECVLCP